MKNDKLIDEILFSFFGNRKRAAKSFLRYNGTTTFETRDIVQIIKLALEAGRKEGRKSRNYLKKTCRWHGKPKYYCIDCIDKSLKNLKKELKKS